MATRLTAAKTSLGLTMGCWIAQPTPRCQTITVSLLSGLLYPCDIACTACSSLFTYPPVCLHAAGILWGSLMGNRVLDITVSDPSHNVRAYAHCSSNTVSPLLNTGAMVSKPLGTGLVTVLLLNLSPGNATLDLPRQLTGVSRVEYRLTASAGGNAGQSMDLNGKTLEYTKMALPSMPGRAVPDGGAVVLAGQSAAFLVFDTELSICD